MNTLLEIPGSDNYQLDIKNNRVVPVNGGETINIKDGSYTLPLYGYLITRSKAWLENLCHSGIVFTSDYSRAILELDFVDYNLTSHGDKRKSMPVFTNPVYANGYDDFRIVPPYPTLAVAKDGRYLRINEKRIMTPKGDNKLKYVSIDVYDFMSKTIHRQLMHRLVAMAWVKNDDFATKPIVDHNDGDKTNYHADNLEWVSFKENARRKAEQGLITDNLMVKVHDYKEEKTYIFSSMSQACKFMGRSKINRLEEFCNAPKLVNGRYQIKLMDDKSEWDFKDALGKYVVKVEGKDHYFERLKDIKDHFDLQVSDKKGLEAVKAKLLKLHPNSTIIAPEPVKQNVSGYQVMDINSGETKTFVSRKEIVDYTGLSKSTVAKAITVGPETSFGGFVIRPETTAPWPIVTTHSGVRSMKVKLSHFNSKKPKIVDSIRQAAMHLNVDKNLIYRVMDTNTTLKGYLISKVS